MRSRRIRRKGGLGQRRGLRTEVQKGKVRDGVGQAGGGE